MKDPDKTIKEAVKDAQHTLTEYVQPGERDCEETINMLLTALDNNDVAEAVLESDEEEKHHGGRQDPAGAARSNPH